MNHLQSSAYALLLLIALATNSHSETAASAQQSPASLTASASAKSITFGCAFQPDNISFQRLRKNLTTVWNNLGYQVSLQHMPHSRVGFELEQGRIDGDCARTIIPGSQYDNVFFIRSWVTPRYIHAYQMSEFPTDFTVSNDLKSKRIVFMRGTQIISQFLQENQLTGIPVTTQKQAIKMVVGGHADVVMGFSSPIEGALDTLSMSGKLYKQPVSQAIPIYLAIHKRHQHLQSKLEEQIRTAASYLPLQ